MFNKHPVSLRLLSDIDEPHSTQPMSTSFEASTGLKDLEMAIEIAPPRTSSPKEPRYVIVSRRVPLVSAVILLLCIAPTPAHAYLDPGTGSILLQGVLAAIAGVVAWMATSASKCRAAVKALFRRNLPHAKDGRPDAREGSDAP
jgi:hypothetical protein